LRTGTATPKEKLKGGGKALASLPTILSLADQNGGERKYGVKM